MVSVLLRISLLLAILVPTWATAQNCTTWVLCPYLEDATDPETSRYVSLAKSEDLLLLDNIRWYETAVEGREDELGQAVICIYGKDEDKTAINAAAVEMGCDVLPRGQVNKHLVAPFETSLNREGKTRFLNGEGRGVERKKRKLWINPNIKDELVSPTQ